MPQYPLALQDDAPTVVEPEGPEAAYIARASHFTALRDSFNSRRYMAANVSVVLFLATLICLSLGVWRGGIFWLVAALLFASFVLAFRRQGMLDETHRRYETLWTINREAQHRLRREWDAFPLRQPPQVPADSLFAGDLDLLGHASLQHLLNTATTPTGQARLQDWLLQPADPTTIRARQLAVAELAPMRDFRDELTLFGRLSGMSRPAYERFIAWAEQDPWLAHRPWLVWLSRILPVMTIGTLIAQLIGLTQLPIWLGLVAINLLVTRQFGKPVEDLLDQVSERQAVFQPYAGVFALAAAQPFQAPLLRRIQADISADRIDADAAMRRLGRIMQVGDLRRSMFFPVVQASLLWNFHTLWMLEGWQRTSGKHVRSWLETLSELEALAALAALAHDNPSWAYPSIAEDGEKHITARNLGHPLLPPEVCVGNDVRVGPPGTFLLVTGSNMSGKSTLLRAIGVNIVLAQAGAPVCADDMALPPVALATSVRVQDSLEYGVSYYLAELRRIKDVVDAATATRATGERVPLFLLDEILHGTNTSERQIAARRILRHLLGLGATGVVSTHDLTLADAPDLAQVSQQVHFTEQFTRGPEGPVMRFDYRLRPGVATSTNALKLMEIVGLPVDDDSA